MELAFGSNLKRLRKKNGLTRMQLAQQIDYSEKAIEKWEIGTSIPPVVTVCKLAEFFHVSVDALLKAENLPIQYLLGIDGGGTKTEFLLTDLDGNEISRVIMGATNPITVGIENTKQILQEGVRQVCAGIALEQVSVFAGLAGIGTGGNIQVVAQLLKQMSFGAVGSGSDIDTALQICLHGENGMGVIMGTGITAFTQCDGKRHQIAGGGYLLDKGGSGFNLGADVLDSALRQADGRGGSPLLLQMVEGRLQNALRPSISKIYSDGKSGIAGFAPLVFAAWEQNDREAGRIIRRNVQEVCQIIAAGCAFCPENPKVAICGGLAKKADVLMPFFEESLTCRVRLEFTTEPVVNGAVALAKTNQD